MARPNTPANIKRKLYYESCGHCLNPSCRSNFFEKDCGEKAHIIPVKNGGLSSHENIILLCANCHEQFDREPSSWDPNTLTEWKKTNRENIEAMFTQEVHNFVDLKSMVAPILENNQKIFENYGPHINDTNELWNKFEYQLIANNKRLELMLNKNRKLLPYSNQDIVDNFILHSKEFAETRDDPTIPRKILFPEKLLSIFGLAKVDTGLMENVSIVQNIITHLQQNGNVYINFSTPNPELRYLNEAGAETTLDLTDGPNLMQIVFTNRLFKPKNTSLRLTKLIFFLNWLSGSGIEYEFHTYPDLSRLMLNGTHEIQLFYEYTLSLSDLHHVKKSPDLVCVNLYNWNGGLCTAAAKNYANSVDMKVFNQEEFFIFAHRNIE